ncbi:MAG: response regulator transcription factor [Bacteroidota bacterium]
MKVLIVEDEQKLCTLIKHVLEENSYEVDVAYDGQIGEKLALRKNYDIIILDIIIPGINGLELCKIIKQNKPSTPILMLTALGTTEDKVTGLESGADDYLLKPFEFAELIARMRALVRRSGTSMMAQNTLLQYEDLKLDINKKVAIREGKEISLTAKEFQLLEYFIHNKGRVISRSELASKIWDIRFDTGTNVVEVYLNILRKKIDKDFDNKLLHTRKGLGYILQKEV